MNKREKHAHGVAKLEDELLYVIQTYSTCDLQAKPIYARQWRELARSIVALGGDSPDPPPDGSGGGPGFPPPPPNPN